MTKLITSLDQLEPGMKTKDGWEILELPFYGDLLWRVRRRRRTAWLDYRTIEEHFLNQEVEVPE